MADDAQRRVREVLPPEAFATYIPLSLAAILLVPAGRWDEVEAILAEVDEPTVAPNARIIWLGLVGGLALRRGDLKAPEQRLRELRPLALEAGSPMRIVPMACLVLPWAALVGRRDELREATDEILAAIDGRWSASLSTAPMTRAMAHAGETDLLLRATEALRGANAAPAGRLGTSLAAAEGLLALAEGNASKAAEHLSASATRERELGFVYDAACVELDLARALEADGDEAGAAEVQARALAVLEPLGCVHPF